MDTTRIAELRSALEAKQAFIKEGIDKGLKIDGQNVEVSTEDWKALTKAKDEGEQIKSLIQMEMFPEEVKSFFSSLEEPAGDSSAVAAAAAAMGFKGQMGAMEAQDLGARFVKSDQFQFMKKSGRLTMDEPFTVEGVTDVPSMGTYGQKDVFTGSVNPLQSRGFGSIQFDPTVPRGQRTYRVRDLFNVATTSANLIDYFRVLGFAENPMGVNGGRGAAAPVADRMAADGVSPATGGATDVFGMKPKSTLRFESAQAPVRTIAHWEAAHRNVLQDEPQLQSTINNELLYGLALEEDDQILNGDGTGENLLGILHTPNIQSYLMSSHAGDRKSDALRRTATLSFLANFPGTGFVLHPFDWEDIELQKATGDGQYMLVTNFAIGASTSIWRQPVVETPAIAQGSWLTGAFGLGAQLYDRQVANVRIAEQHADFFVRNAVAILAEERIALAVKRPESFVLGSFS